jgi:hypothetical protein
MRSCAGRVTLVVAQRHPWQAYMRLLLDHVTVDHHSVRLEGSPAILEKLASRGLPNSSPEVLSFVQEWRPGEDSNLRPPV